MLCVFILFIFIDFYFKNLKNDELFLS